MFGEDVATLKLLGLDVRSALNKSGRRFRALVMRSNAGVQTVAQRCTDLQRSLNNDSEARRRKVDRATSAAQAALQAANARAQELEGSLEGHAVWSSAMDDALKQSMSEQENLRTAIAERQTAFNSQSQQYQ